MDEIGTAEIYEVCDAETINVLLVGRSQTGKSTLINTLVNPFEGCRRKGYSQTKDPEFRTLVITNVKTGVRYQLNMIDTPGLQEYRADGERRGDEELLQIYAQFLTHNITRLHVVCFVTEAGRMQMQDLAPFQKIVDYLGPEFAKISMIVATHAETTTKEQRDGYERDIEADEIAGKFFKFCQYGIAYTGCVDLNQMEALREDGMTEEELAAHRRLMLNRVCNIRDELLTKFLVAVSKEPVPVRILEHCREVYLEAVCNSIDESDEDEKSVAPSATIKVMLNQDQQSKKDRKWFQQAVDLLSCGGVVLDWASFVVRPAVNVHFC